MPGTGEASTSATHGGPGWLGRDSFILIAGRGMRAAAMGILSVLIAIYLDLLGLTTAQIGLVLTLSLVGGVVLSVPATIIGDMVGRKRLVVALSLITSFAGIALAITDNLAWLAAGSFLGGYAATGMNVGPLLQIEQTAMAEVAPGPKRTAAFTYLGIVSSASRALGALAAGLPLILSRTLGTDLVDAYRITFGVYTGLNFVATGLYLFVSPAVEASAKEAKRVFNPLAARSRNRIFGFSFLLGVDSFAGGMIIDPLISFWLASRFGMAEGAIAPVIATSYLINMASLWVAPRAAGRFGLINTMVWTQVIANGMVLVFGFAPTAPLAVAAWLIRGLFNEMDVPTRQSYAMAVVEPRERMAMAGIANVSRAVGRAASPALTGLLWSGAALSVAPFVVATAIKFGYNGALLLGFRDIRPPEESGSNERTRIETPGA
ncbi:MAG: MFS transporter [Chloroflexi bacterium]|nr:MFS transporter [Chloroflexota bacterium]